jgi:hypothetical protein
MILDKSLKFEPDMIIWLTTLEAFPNINQVETPILQGNPVYINQLIEKYDLNNFEKREVRNSDFTIINQRRNIADRINLQRLGFLWDATGKDQHYPEKYNKAQRDFEEPRLTYYGAENTTELEKTLAFEIIKQAVVKNPDINFVLVNEPILTSSGFNSHLQYNYYYPRWAYDYFREKLSVFTNENEIAYYDFWKLIEEDGFTNSAIHLDAHNEQIFAIEILKIIKKTIEK